MIITIEKDIQASAQRVFDALSDIRIFSAAVPEVVGYEFLSGSEPGPGTKFREKRNRRGRETVTELEITEYRKNKHIRMVADSHGTIWDTVYTLKEENGATLLTLQMEARAYKLVPKFMNPLLKRAICKGVAKNMNDVKRYCEEKEIQHRSK